MYTKSKFIQADKILSNNWPLRTARNSTKIISVIRIVSTFPSVEVVANFLQEEIAISYRIIRFALCQLQTFTFGGAFEDPICCWERLYEGFKIRFKEEGYSA